VAGEIKAIASKSPATTADYLIIEDAADLDGSGEPKKKSITIADLPDGVDATAIHDNLPNEISAITEKVSPVAADILLIEDSVDGSKKKVQVGNLGSTDSTAIHDNVAGEINAITEKLATPAGNIKAADLLLIEDSDDTNNKKKIQLGNLLYKTDIDSLDDVDASAPVDNSLLQYNSTSGNWEAVADYTGGDTPIGNVRAQSVYIEFAGGRTEGTNDAINAYFAKPLSVGTESSANGFIDRVFLHDLVAADGYYYINFKEGQFSKGPLVWGSFNRVNYGAAEEMILNCVRSCPSGVSIRLNKAAAEYNFDFILHCQQPYHEIAKSIGEPFAEPVEIFFGEYEVANAVMQFDGDFGMIQINNKEYELENNYGITNDGGITFRFNRYNSVTGPQNDYGDSWFNSINYSPFLLFDGANGKRWAHPYVYWNITPASQYDGSIMVGDAVEDANGLTNITTTTDVIEDALAGGNASGIGWMQLYFSDNGDQTDTCLMLVCQGAWTDRNRTFSIQYSFDEGVTWNRGGAYGNVFGESDGTVRAVRRSGFYHLTGRYITEAGTGSTAATFIDDPSNELDFASHAFKTGDKVVLSTTVGAIPTELATAPVLYVRDVGHLGTSISFHPTKKDARDNTSPIEFSGGLLPISVETSSIDKHKMYMFSCVGAYGAASTNYNTGDLCLLQCYPDQIYGQIGAAPNYYFAALVLRQPSSAGETQYLHSTLDDTQASVGQFFYITNETSTDNRSKLFLGHMAQTELDKDSPTTFTDRGDISPFTGHVGLDAAAANELIIDRFHWDQGSTDTYDNYWKAGRSGRNHRIYRVGSSKTLLVLTHTHLDSNNTAADIMINLGIIVIPDYSDFTSGKEPWYLPIKMGNEESGVDISYGEGAFVEDGAGGLYVAYRKFETVNAYTSGIIYSEKIDLQGASTTTGNEADGKQLTPDPWFDNDLGYGAGSLAQWTTAGTTTPTSVANSGFNCVELTTGAVDPSVESASITTSRDTWYHLSGWVRTNDANNAVEIVIKNASSAEVSVNPVTVTVDTDEWQEFHFKYQTANDATGDSHTLLVRDVGSSGVSHVTNLVFRKEFVQISDTYGQKELSDRPVDTSGNPDMSDGLAGFIQVSDDKQHVWWQEDDIQNLRSTKHQHFKAVT
jgi:hypothetical protein